MIAGIVMAVIAALIANELSDFSPWVATSLVRWSAAQAFRDDPDRAEDRAEDLEADVNAIPGKLCKLGFGLSFGAAGVHKWTVRNLETGPRWLRVLLTMFLTPLYLLFKGLLYLLLAAVVLTEIGFINWVLTRYPLLAGGLIAVVGTFVLGIRVKDQVRDMRRKSHDKDVAAPSEPSIGT